MLEDFDRVLPGAAERILALAERQQAHRHVLERIVIEGDSRRATTGLWLGAALILAALISGTYLIMQGHEAQGLLIGLGFFAAGVGTFVWGQKQRQREVEQMQARVDRSRQ